MDKSVAEAQRDALAAALANLLGQAGGMASYLPVGEKNRGALRDFAKLSSQRMGETSEALSEAATNEDLGVLGEAAIRYPVNTVAYLPELLNPVSKVQAWKPISKVAQYAPEVANAAWHAARGYAQGGAPQAGVSAGANIVGETVMEPLPLEYASKNIKSFHKDAAIGSAFVSSLQIIDPYTRSPNLSPKQADNLT